MVVKFFNVAIDAIFKNWTALQLAVNQSAGGPQSKEKAEWMKGVTENWFYENSNLDKYEVEDFLEQIIINEFYVQIDDGSLYEVASKVCEFYDICTKNDEETIRKKLLTLPRCDLSKCRVKDGDDAEVGLENPEENLESIENLEIEKKKKYEPEIDEDGFEMVQSRRGKGKKQKTKPADDKKDENTADDNNDKKDEKEEKDDPKDEKGEQNNDENHKKNENNSESPSAESSEPVQQPKTDLDKRDASPDPLDLIQAELDKYMPQ